MYIANLQDDYSVINRNGIIEVLKNGEVDIIRNDRYCGDRVVLFLMQKIEDLATRPTCGKEQRKFLNLLEKHGEIHEGDETKWGKLVLSNGVIQENCETEIFENSEGFDSLDLQKVIRGE